MESGPSPAYEAAEVHLGYLLKNSSAREYPSALADSYGGFKSFKALEKCGAYVCGEVVDARTVALPDSVGHFMEGSAVALTATVGFPSETVDRAIAAYVSGKLPTVVLTEPYTVEYDKRASYRAFSQEGLDHCGHFKSVIEPASVNRDVTNVDNQRLFRDGFGLTYNVARLLRLAGTIETSHVLRIEADAQFVLGQTDYEALAVQLQSSFDDPS